MADQLTSNLDISFTHENILEKSEVLKLGKSSLATQSVEHQGLQFPIKLKIMTTQETKAYHLKKLYELSLKFIGEIPQLHEPSWEQKQWLKSRMSGPSWSWEVWDA